MTLVAPTVSLVIDRLREKLTDIPALAERYQQHAFREYYDLLVQETVTDLLSIPVDRIIMGLPPEIDDDESEETEEMSVILANFFDKSIDHVTLDIVRAIKEDPGADLRHAKLYRHMNKLH